MDEIVRQAMAKWPHVPHCFGWLALDARGGWWLRDDSTQAAGPFPQAKGSLLRHDKLIDFIQRNYECDEAGQWYFQNGPQRVYVELEAAPLILRVGADFSVTSHTGRQVLVRQCLVDEAGHLYLATNLGLGLVHSLDMDLAADAVEAGLWTPQDVKAQDLPRQFGFVRSPAAQRPALAAAG